MNGFQGGQGRSDQEIMTTGTILLLVVCVVFVILPWVLGWLWILGVLA